MPRLTQECWDTALCTGGVSFPSSLPFHSGGHRAPAPPRWLFSVWSLIFPASHAFHHRLLPPSAEFSETAPPPLAWFHLADGHLPFSQEIQADEKRRQNVSWLGCSVQLKGDLCADTAPSTTEGFRHISKRSQPHVSEGGNSARSRSCGISGLAEQAQHGAAGRALMDTRAPRNSAPITPD